MCCNLIYANRDCLKWNTLLRYCLSYTSLVEARHTKLVEARRAYCLCMTLDLRKDKTEPKRKRGATIETGEKEKCDIHAYIVMGCSLSCRHCLVN